MTRNNLHWVLITSPDEHGNAQINIAATNGSQVSIYMSGSAAFEIADTLLMEMYDDDYEPERTFH